MEGTGAALKATGAHVGGDGFRLDINALRALSVISVLGYHLRIPGFAGGFAGVDVFLVITGYLMTGKVLNDLSRDRFSFFAFLAARMRRIYPALAVVTLASVIAGWFVTLPDEYLRHLRQALYGLVFFSNAFGTDSGYFGMAAQTKPLLHTWSLSVEWQFYFWMPLVVWPVWRLVSGPISRIGAATLTFQVVAGLSLAWCLWQSQHDAAGSAFFSLAARAWEPLAGGLIAAAEIQRRSDGAAKASSKASWLESWIIAAAGWALVAGCIAYPIAQSQWPGWLTILPILGAAMIVAARQGSGGRSLLGIYPIQRIGDWSYSIYLWHWPLWVFALGWLSLRGYDVGAAQKILIVLASLVLGAVSYHYVEQPVRIRRDIWTPRELFEGAGIVFSLLFGFTALAFLNAGFPSRLPAYLLPAELARRTSTPRDECFANANSIKKASETYCRFGAEEIASKSSAILWGDSFANQYIEPMSAAALASGVHGLIATQANCRAFLDDPLRNSGETESCREFNRRTMDFVLGHSQPGIIVLGSNWKDAIELSALVDRLLASGKTVVLIMPLLNIGFDVVQRWVENQLRAGHAIDEWKVPADPNLMMSGLRNEIVRLLDQHSNNPRLVMVDPSSVVCEHDYCYLVRSGQTNFRDTAHISNLNAMQFKGVFESAFRSALRASNGAQKKSD